MRSIALTAAATVAVGAAALVTAPGSAADPADPTAAPPPPIAAATLPVDDWAHAQRAASRSYQRRALRHVQRLAAARARARKQAAARARERAAQARAEAAAAHAPASGGIPAVWRALVQCEAGGNWADNTGNGFYGGPQFTLGTWSANGGQGMPYAASPATQLAVARRVLASQGPGAWPVCGPRVGLKQGD